LIDVVRLLVLFYFISSLAKPARPKRRSEGLRRTSMVIGYVTESFVRGLFPSSVNSQLSSRI